MIDHHFLRIWLLVCSILRLIDEETHETVSNKNIIVRIHWWFLLYSYQLLLDIFDIPWRIVLYNELQTTDIDCCYYRIVHSGNKYFCSFCYCQTYTRKWAWRNGVWRIWRNAVRVWRNGQWGAGPVIQESVDTGNQHLDKAINKFYNCLSHTHEDPPTIQKVDNCYYQTLSGGSRQT